MPFVLDASVAVAWAFEDETAPYTEHILDLLTVEAALVPAVWPLEVANAVLSAERRQRIVPADTARFSTLIRGLRLEVDSVGLEQVFTRTLDLARAHSLSVYDASYLELAMRKGVPLATQDRLLREAAEAEGIQPR